MARAKSLISERLTEANVAISNALGDSQIGQLLGVYGYQTPKLSDGKTVLEAAEAAVQRQVAAAGAQRTAGARADRTYKEAKDAYQALAQVARAAFIREKASLSTMGLDNPMPRRQALFLTMAAALFDNASQKEEIAAKLSDFGFTLERLSAERAKVVELSAAVQAYEAAKGAAQQATAEQDAAMDTLKFWMSAFVRVAKVALREQPQLLEKLGILKRNGRTAAQRKAPGKAAATRKANGGKVAAAG